jgi:hypothetical protein
MNEVCPETGHEPGDERRDDDPPLSLHRGRIARSLEEDFGPSLAAKALHHGVEITQGRRRTAFGVGGREVERSLDVVHQVFDVFSVDPEVEYDVGPRVELPDRAVGMSGDDWEQFLIEGFRFRPHGGVPAGSYLDADRRCRGQTVGPARRVTLQPTGLDRHAQDGVVGPGD